MTRLEWFKENVDYSKMLEHHSYRDCDIMVVNRFGDIIEYYVEGTNESNYKMSVR